MFARTVDFVAQLLAKHCVVNTDDMLIQSQAAMYKSQIDINYAQVLVAQNKFEKAINILSENVDFVLKYASEYYSEAIYSLSYTQYLAKEYDKAMEMALIAKKEYVKIGELTGAQCADKIVVGCLYAENKNDKALEYYNNIFWCRRICLHHLYWCFFSHN